MRTRLSCCYADAAKDLVAAYVTHMQRYQACDTGTPWTELGDLEARDIGMSVGGSALRLLRVSTSSPPLPALVAD